ELIYFVEGKTTGVIGDGFQQFDEGQLIILGANLPHVLQTDNEFSRPNPNCTPFGVVMQFTEEFLGSDFWLKPETQPIIKMLRKARRGLSFKNVPVGKVSPVLLNMH